jgi:hypothetical protein
MKWEKERSIKKCSTFHISVDEDINLPKWDVRENSIKKDIYLVRAKEALCTC